MPSLPSCVLYSRERSTQDTSTRKSAKLAMRSQPAGPEFHISIAGNDLHPIKHPWKIRTSTPKIHWKDRIQIIRWKERSFFRHLQPPLPSSHPLSQTAHLLGRQFIEAWQLIHHLLQHHPANFFEGRLGIGEVILLERTHGSGIR